MYLSVNDWQNAMEAAFIARDLEFLLEMRNKNKNQTILNELERKINELRIK